MRTEKNRTSGRDEGLSNFFWNLVGGAMVAAMVAGVVYVLIGSIGTNLLDAGNYWELTYLKWYFIVIFAVYILMPTMLANVIGTVFGTKSSASGTKPKV